jgi:hypothetical protein
MQHSLPTPQHSPPTLLKRPIDDTDPTQNTPRSSKRLNNAVVSPPTIEAIVPVSYTGTPQQRLRRVASECWNFMTACETEQPPLGVSRAELITADVSDLESRVFRLCRRPQSAARVRCLLCWYAIGVVKACMFIHHFV